MFQEGNAQEAMALYESVFPGEDKVASNKQLLSFGKDQTIIDFNKLVWEPLTGEGIPPGPEIATLRGSLAAGGGKWSYDSPRTIRFPTTAM